MTFHGALEMWKGPVDSVPDDTVNSTGGVAMTELGDALGAAAGVGVTDGLTDAAGWLVAAPDTPPVFEFEPHANRSEPRMPAIAAKPTLDTLFLVIWKDLFPISRGWPF